MVDKTSSGVGQDEISSVVQVLLRKNAILTQVWQDVTAFAMPGDKTISFPRVENQFVSQKLTGAEKGSDQELVFELDTLALSEEAHIQWVIKKFDQARSKIAILQAAIQNSTITQAEQLDVDLYAEFLAGLGNPNITGGITQSNIVNAKVALNKARVPRSGRVWVFGNDAHGDLLKIAGFVDASQSNLNIVLTGQIGTLYGDPVLESDIVNSGTGFLSHKQALAYGFGAAPDLEDESAIAYGTGSRRWVMDQLYGQKTLNKGLMAVQLVA